jgi:chromosome segregation ATPase
MNVSEQPPSKEIRDEGTEPEIASTKWQEIEPRWKAILGLEATIDTLRINMESLRTEMEASFRRMLTADEKLDALATDVVEWNKAKSRLHYALPKAKEFIHRAIWAKGTPERKRLDEFFKNPIGPHLSLSQIDQVLEELEVLRKDRQVLATQGAVVQQECKSISADVQAALRRLQSNAASRPARKRGATGAKSRGY